MVTDQFRVFTVAAGGHLTLDRVRVSHGDVDGDGGGIHNAGTLILQNGSIVTGNTASGNGGGIYNSGTLQMSGGCLVGNRAASSTAVHSTVPVTISGVWWGRASGPGDGAVNDRVMATNVQTTAPAGCGTEAPPAESVTVQFEVAGAAVPDASVTHPIKGYRLGTLRAPNQIIPIVDRVWLKVRLTNNTQNDMTGSSFKLSPLIMESDVFGQPDKPLRLWQAGSGGLCCDGGGTKNRVQWRGITIPAGQTLTLDLIVQARFSGPIELDYELVNGVNTNTGTAKVMDVAITRIPFATKKIRSLIFWGIFNETSEDEYFSGDAAEGLNPFYTVGDPRSKVNFLKASPYCVADATSPVGHRSDAVGERIGVDAGWDADVKAISHCNPPDHRAFYANGIINNMIVWERLNTVTSGGGYDEYAYMRYFVGGNNWGGSYEAPEADLWLNTRVCDNLPYDTYQEAISTRKPAIIIDWLDAYLDCQLSNTSTDPNQVKRRTYFQLAHANIMRHIQAETSNLATDSSSGITSMLAFNQGHDTAHRFRTDVANCANASQSDVLTAYGQHIQTIRTNGPQFPSILRPVLRADLYDRPKDGVVSYVHSCYQWVTFVFQQPARPFKR